MNNPLDIRDWFGSLLPVLTALLGLVAGLMAPFLAGRASTRLKRRDEQRALCGTILDLFRGVNVIGPLTDPHSSTRRILLLTAARLKDDGARRACTELVEYSSRPESSHDEILDRWTAMVEEVARAYRAAS
jgi:hypothetical protein